MEESIMSKKEIEELKRRIIIKKQLVIWTQEEIKEMEERLAKEKGGVK
jgi:hypothetical protein